MKIAYADCFSGISGDMFLAALLDAGLSLETLREGIEGLGLPEKVELRLTETHKGVLRAADLEVIVPDSRRHRGLSDVLEILSGGRLSDGVEGAAARVFTLLAEAEARVHGEPVDQVQFHEVGALDSIVDVVGAAIGLDSLGIERLYASPLPYGSGTVEGRHGPLPLPAPATLELLRLAHAPLTPSSAQVELITPTGAAILVALAVFERPNLTIESIGVGAGKRDLPWPNVMRLLVGDVPADGATEMVQLETNIDDMNPQFYGHVMDKLLAAGARDVFLTPIQMKKNRPAAQLTVLCENACVSQMADLIFAETTSFGVRMDQVSRFKLERKFETVKTPFGEITVKLGLRDGKVIQSAPEFESVRAAAEKHNVPVRAVYEAALKAAS